MPARSPNPAAAHRPMPLRHKLMLALALEIVVLGFRQADLNPHHAGVAVEEPAQAHHAVV